MSILKDVELIRVSANNKLDPKKKGMLGQFFTPATISMFMASLFDNINKDVSLLDPGCGPCSLSAAFLDEVIRRGKTKSLNITTYDIEELIASDIKKSLNLCQKVATANNLECQTTLKLSDFILTNCEKSGLFEQEGEFTHVIMNPPYKKISSSSPHRKALSAAGIETVNLYTGFVALAIQKLKKGGELVAIIPRSFCNGPYYQPFRELIIKNTAIKKIHIFDSRSNAFAEDDVLQENIIIHLIKDGKQKDVLITSSPNSGFHFDDYSKTVTAEDMTTRTVPFTSIVQPKDKQQFIHIAANNRDQLIIDQLSVFTSSLTDVGLQVSTGPVVDFRLKDDLRKNLEEDAVPLIYPIHLNGGINWPKESKKPNAIKVSKKSRSWLWKNQGHFLIVRRFSSKEERRRIVATLYNSSLPGDLIGFENKLNVFHINKTGMAPEVAKGLYIYLNCTLLDKYYRLFGGHTQVNATDLRNIHYPNESSLRRIGFSCKTDNPTQKDIDNIINQEINFMTGTNNNSPLAAQEKIDQALEIIQRLGMPRAQQNERSALTFLSLINLYPNGTWQEIGMPLIGVTPIMDWCKDVYGKEYAPNTRETFRRQTLHQFVSGGIVRYNPDKPDRPVNSPKACYQITPELFAVLKTYNTSNWDSAVEDWLECNKTLAEQYAKAREMEMIPLTLQDGTEITLSPGHHSQLIYDIVFEFGPRFAPGAQVIYLGDTGDKLGFFDKSRLLELGVSVDEKGKLPDVVMYWEERNWLLLIESVTTHGPVDGKRHNELSELFKNATPGLVYVTAFPDRKTMGKYLSEISWETEVWVSEAPTHMIHFNGDRFLGPHG